MKLSVIMPVYNERATLEEIVRRVQAVDLTVDSDGSNRLLAGPLTLARELVIVDDGSTDGTRAILDRWRADPPPGMSIIYHEQNRGKGAALRTGFQHATGDIPQFVRLALTDEDRHQPHRGSPRSAHERSPRGRATSSTP